MFSRAYLPLVALPSIKLLYYSAEHILRLFPGEREQLFCKKRMEGDYFAYASTRSRAVIMPTNLSSLTIGNLLVCCSAIVAAAL